MNIKTPKSPDDKQRKNTSTLSIHALKKQIITKQDCIVLIKPRYNKYYCFSQEILNFSQI